MRASHPVAILALLHVAALLACDGDVEPDAPSPPAVERGSAPTDEQREAMEALEALGYAAGTEKPRGRGGVTIHVRERACAGASLYVSGHAPEARLIDMEGRELHRWGIRFAAVWPGRELPKEAINPDSFRRAWVTPKGELYAIFEGLGLVKLDRESKLLWSFGGRAHHDLDFAPDGRIFVLTREAKIDPAIDAERPILEDFVTILDGAGRELETISLLECLRASPHLPERIRAAGDLFHANALQILDGRHAALAPAFAAGNVLVSLRNTDQLAVVDLGERRALWALTGSWRRQHEPQLVDGGRILCFDNRGLKERSRVIEIDPSTGEIDWSYAPEGAAAFYSERCGSCQRLANDDTLIVDSEGARAFEVDRRGEIVWQFENPHAVPGDEEFAAMLYDLVRLERDFPLDWLAR